MNALEFTLAITVLFLGGSVYANIYAIRTAIKTLALLSRRENVLEDNMVRLHMKHNGLEGVMNELGTELEDLKNQVYTEGPKDG